MSVGIEAVAFQKLLKPALMLRARLDAQRSLSLPAIVDLKADTRMSKEARIRGFIPYVNGGNVHVLPNEVLLTQQIYQFPNSVGTLHVLDAVAYGPQMWTIPLSDEEIWSQETMEYAMLEGRNPTTGY